MAAKESETDFYWGSGSFPCWRAMLCLAEKKVKYQSHLLSMDKKEHKTEEILKLNPRGQLPIFKHGQVIINESVGICQYVESAFKGQGTQLMPEEPSQQAAVLQRSLEAENVRQKMVLDTLMYMWTTKPEDISQDLLKQKKQNLAQEVNYWEGHLAKLGPGSHIAGKDFTVADATFWPSLAFLVRLGMPIQTCCPNLAKYYEMVKQRPTVQETWPPHWKKSPGPDYFKDLF
ncbi:glutathione S-transferase A-like [Branchiostoma floridae x Branchiostoma belcheri]